MCTSRLPREANPTTKNELRGSEMQAPKNGLKLGCVSSTICIRSRYAFLHRLTLDRLIDTVVFTCVCLYVSQVHRSVQCGGR